MAHPNNESEFQKHNLTAEAGFCKRVNRLVVFKVALRRASGRIKVPGVE
jgi:hypothetical protein